MISFVINITHQQNERLYVVICNIILNQVKHGITTKREKTCAIC